MYIVCNIYIVENIPSVKFQNNLVVEVSEMKHVYRQTSRLYIYFITSFEKKHRTRSNKDSSHDFYPSARHSQTQHLSLKQQLPADWVGLLMTRVNYNQINKSASLQSACYSQRVSSQSGRKFPRKGLEKQTGGNRGRCCYSYLRKKITHSK